MFSFKWKGQEKSKHSSTFSPLLALHPFISWVSFVSTLWHTPQNLISNNMINNTNLFSEPIWKCSEKSNYGIMEITFLQWILVSSTNKWVQNYLSHRVTEQSYRLPTALVKTLGIFPGIFPFLSLFTYLKTAKCCWFYALKSSGICPSYPISTNSQFRSSPLYWNYCLFISYF